MTRDAFLAAIRDAPDDDTHRLVFADWLEEQGEARAAARMRWWCVILARFRTGFTLPEESDFSTQGTTLLVADDWRWRLGCLLAVWVGETIFLPWFDPAPWPERL